MSYLLNIAYCLAFIILSPWLVYKALTTGKYRRGVWSKISGRAIRRETNRPCVWFHGVSVGEIHLLRPVVAGFQKRHPDWECVISTTTDTGYDEACKRFADVPVFFWPFDFSWAVGRALNRVKPSLVVLAECELWPNFLRIARKKDIPVAVINGRMSPRSLRRFLKLSWVASSLFRKLNMCAVQTEEYAAAYRTLGADNVQVTGSVKYDGANSDRGNPKTRELRRLLAINDDALVWIAGSTQTPEEEIVLNIYRKASLEHPNLRLVLVPRQKERFDEVANLLHRSEFDFIRRSQVSPNHSVSPSLCPPIVLVDTFGELGALWGLADVAFVGGSLDGKRGGQNMIEPAAYGAAVLFGPHTWNFKDTVARLLEHNAAIQIADAAELERETLHLLADPQARAALGLNARRFVQSQQGATERTLDVLDELLQIRMQTVAA